MSEFKKLTISSITAILIFAGCERMKPDVSQVPSYAEIDTLLTSQFDLLYKKSLIKEVWLDGQSESQDLEMDSLGWRAELSFLKEINPNQPEYVGAFDKEESKNIIVLVLGEKESGSLSTFSFSREKGDITSIEATIHEDKDVYVHHRDISLTLTGGRIREYQIDGYQKIMLKDTIRFRIRGSVVN